MAIGILGRKIGMTYIFNDNGNPVSVTVIEAGPCPVLQVKTAEKDKYSAVQIGFDHKKENLTTKPLLGKFKKINVTPKRFIREIRLNADEKYEIGQEIKIDIFNPGDYVDVTGTSIGKGFQGGMKRWNWRGGGGSHGSMQHRAVGSIGSSTTPGRVFRGHHLPGRMGNQRVTTQNLEVVNVDKENNLILLKGAVPGHKNSYLIIKKSGRKKAKAKIIQPTAEKTKAAAKTEKPKAKK